MVFGNKIPWYGGFIWQTARPQNWKSYCVMIYNRGAQFFRNIASRPFKACICIVASWPGLFFTLRTGVGRPIYLSQEALDRVQWRSRRSKLVVIDISSFYQAIILHVSVISHLVEFLLGIL
jgi:hypothetical protein